MKFLPNDESDEDDDASSVIDISDFLTDTALETVTKEQPFQDIEDTSSQDMPEPSNEELLESKETKISSIPQKRSAAIRIVLGDSVRQWRNQSAVTSDDRETIVWRQTSGARIDWPSARLQVAENKMSIEMPDGTAYIAKEIMEQSETSIFMDAVGIWDPTQRVYRLEIPRLIATDVIPSQSQPDMLAPAGAVVDPWTQAKQADEALRKRKQQGPTTGVKRPAKRGIGGPKKSIK